MSWYMEYDMPITAFKLNFNNIVIPEEVMCEALKKSVGQPILTSIEIQCDEEIIGVIDENHKAKIWTRYSSANPEYCEIEPEFTVNKSHKEGDITVMDDITICGIYLKP